MKLKFEIESGNRVDINDTVAVLSALLSRITPITGETLPEETQDASPSSATEDTTSWTVPLINENILKPLMTRIGEDRFKNEALSKYLLPLITNEFKAQSLDSIKPENLGAAAKRMQEVIATIPGAI